MPEPCPSPCPELRAGDRARVWKRRYAEHGMRGTVALVDHRGIWPVGGEWVSGPFRLAGPLPLQQVATEQDYQAARAGDPHGWLWPE